MDLCELPADRKHPRHPWELARIRAIKQILTKDGILPRRVLDVGCGDGFTAASLFADDSIQCIFGLDIFLDSEQAQRFSQQHRKMQLHTKAEDLPEDPMDLVMFLDVLEHVEEPVALLQSFVDRHLADSGRVLITVPAFQSLFSEHDRFLKHYRRYNRALLHETVTAAKMRVLRSGYLFGSLLLPRYMQLMQERRGRKTQPSGVGGWRGGTVKTRMVRSILDADNNVMLLAHRLGLTLPGLTGWVLCGLS